MSGIVVSLDGSADSQHALEWAVTHATLEHTPLTVLAVHQVAASPWTGNPIIYPADRPEAERAVDAVKEAVSKTMSKLGDDRPSSVTVRGFIGQRPTRSSRPRTMRTWSSSQSTAASPGG